MKRKAKIWYEFTDKEDVKTLRDAADALEKNGYVKIILPNVELDEEEPAAQVCASPGIAGGHSFLHPVSIDGRRVFIGGGGGDINNGTATAGPGDILGVAGFGGGGNSYALELAKELNQPISCGGGGGAGLRPFILWIFPDGHTEMLDIGETPTWPKESI